MAKALKIVALVVAVAAAIPTGGGSTALFGLSTATAATVATAVAIGSSFVATLLTKPPSIEGGQTEWRSDPSAFAPIVFGDTLVGGMIVHRKTTDKVGGTKNKYQFIGTILSGCGPIHAVDDTLVDTVSTSFSGGNAVGDLHDRVYQATQLGQVPESSQLMPSGPWPTTPDWTSSSKLSGYAASMNVYVFDGKGDHTFTQIPRTQWRLRGVKCYDPRFDSTYPGGSGTQRWDDETTWVYSTNPYIQALTFAIGWHQGTNRIRVGGVGMPIEAIDRTAFVEAANVADANQWVSGGRVTTGDDKWEVLKSLCQAGGGQPVRYGATLSCIVEQPRISIGTILASDVIGTGSITSTQTRRDRINGIIPKYRSEDHGFEEVPAGVVRNTDYLADDGGIERTKERTYPMVQNFTGDTPDQVAQLAAYDVANAREAGPAVMPLKLRWLGYKAGDCLTVEDTPEFGYFAGRKVIVIKRQLEPESGSVVLTLREETDAKHGWALGQIGVPAPETDAPPVPVREAPEVTDWDVSTRIDTVEGIPSGVIIISGGVTDDTANTIIFEYRPVGSTDWIFAGTAPVSTTYREITGLDPNSEFDVAISYFNGLRTVYPGSIFSSATADATYVTADNTFLKADRV